MKPAGFLTFGFLRFIFRLVFLGHGLCLLVVLVKITSSPSCNLNFSLFVVTKEFFHRFDAIVGSGCGFGILHVVYIFTVMDEQSIRAAVSIAV